MASTLGRAGAAFLLSESERILFIGNSITKHAPLPDRGWLGEWGMAASAPENDYVHQLVSSIAGVKGSAPDFMAKNFAAFENNYGAYDTAAISAGLQSELAFGADVVVLAIGENIGALTSEAQKLEFGRAFSDLLATLKANGNPTIFVRGCFWTSSNLTLYAAANEIMAQAATEAGAIYVDLGDMGSDNSNYAGAEGLYSDPSLAYHPGDKGMKAISDAIFDSMVAHSVPEPSAASLAGAAGLALAGVWWRRLARSGHGAKSA